MKVSEITKERDVLLNYVKRYLRAYKEVSRNCKSNIILKVSETTKERDVLLTYVNRYLRAYEEARGKYTSAEIGKRKIEIRRIDLFRLKEHKTLTIYFHSSDRKRIVPIKALA